MDILESRIKEVISREVKLAKEKEELLEEVKKLRDSIRKLEAERVDANSKLERVIEKVELYLRRPEE